LRRACDFHRRRLARDLSVPQGGLKISNTLSLDEVDDEIRQQTHPSPKPIREFLCGEKKRVISEEDPLLTPDAQPRTELEKPVPLRDLLTRDVLVASANYAFLALVDIAFRALQPVFMSTPVALGGLGLDPPVIGAVMSFFGILNGLFAVFFFSRLSDCFGVKGLYLIGITAAVPCFSLFPVINHLARNSIERSGGLGADVWIAVGLQVVTAVLFCMCYGTHVLRAGISSRPIDLIPVVCSFPRRGVYLHRRRCTK